MKTTVIPFLGIFWILLTNASEPYSCYCQETELLDSIIEPEDQDNLEDALWLEKLWELKEKPVNLNNAYLQELLLIPFLTTQMAEDIIKFRKRGNRFKTLQDLYKIKDVTDEIIDAVEPFVTISGTIRIPSVIYRFQSRLENPLRTGYRENIYQNPFYFQHRILFSSVYHFTAGIIWEKDSGEPNYFDYGSFHFRYQHPSGKFSLTAGDFYQKSGMGLISWSSFGKTLSLELRKVSWHDMNWIEVNRSTQENGFYRGCAIESVLTATFALNFFVSSNKIDGTLSEDSSEINTMYVTGLHRTPTEINKKNQLSEKTFGASLNMTVHDIIIQLSSLIMRYSPRFRPSGTEASYQSLFCCYNFRELQVAGEVALYNTKIPALHWSLFQSAGPVRFEIDSYYYHPDYFAPHARAVGSFQQTPFNKAGTVYLLQYKIIKRIKLGLLIHLNRMLRSSQQNPFIKQDYLLDLKIGFPHQSIKLQYRLYYRYLNDIAFSNKDHKKTEGFRLYYRLDLTKKMRLENRIELRWCRPVNQSSRFYGLDFYQQLVYGDKNWKTTLRWSAFDVPSYDLRIYEIENDLPATVRSVLLTQSGYKFFILFQVKTSNSLQLDFKYQHRFYSDTKEIGSGRDSFPAPSLHEYRLSLLLKL
jgi:hypothetical protein